MLFHTAWYLFTREDFRTHTLLITLISNIFDVISSFVLDRIKVIDMYLSTAMLEIIFIIFYLYQGHVNQSTETDIQLDCHSWNTWGSVTWCASCYYIVLQVQGIQPVHRRKKYAFSCCDDVVLKLITTNANMWSIWLYWRKYCFLCMDWLVITCLKENCV